MAQALTPSALPVSYKATFLCFRTLTCYHTQFLHHFGSQSSSGKFRSRLISGSQFKRKKATFPSALMDFTVTERTDPDMNIDKEFEQEGALLHEFYKIPSIDKACIEHNQLGKQLQATVFFSQINLPANKKRTFVLSAQIPETVRGSHDCQWSLFPIELVDASLVVPSPSGLNVLVVRNGDSSSKASLSSVKLEIWGRAQLRKEIFVAPSVHGPLYADGWFEGVSWNSDETHIAYIAEEPLVQQHQFTPTGCKAGTSAEKEPGSWNLQGDLLEDWGETYAGKRRPALFVLNINSGTVHPVKGIQKDLSVGQVVWAPQASKSVDSYLVFVGWPEKAGESVTCRKLGMKYCYNRHCAIYAVKAPLSEWNNSENTTSSLVLTKKMSSAFLPRFSPDGKMLVFLSANSAVSSGVHCSTNSVHSIYWPSDGTVHENLAINDVVSVVMHPGKDLFPGLYCTSVLAQPWLSDGHTLVLSSIWGSLQVLLAIDLLSGKVSRISPCDSLSSWTVLAVKNNFVLAVSSSPSVPPNLMYGQVSNAQTIGDKDVECDWLNISVPFIDLSERVQSTLLSIKTEILKVPVKDPEIHLSQGAKQPFEAIFISTQAKQNMCNPLIVTLHGGPHSTSVTSFSRNVAFLLSLGFNLLLVNYRGSLGYGEEALQSLPGKIGSQDVRDVLHAIDFVVDRGYANPSKIGILGGSHGGFLTTHLIGQAPDKFVAAVTRNPVCNLSLMIGTTDIPDWCYVEAYGMNWKNAYSEAPSEKDLALFYQMSPLSHISRVKVPVLMLLGAQDLRVPVSNGLQYARALKASGIEVKVILFPNDVHGIDRPQSDFESFLNIGVWFKRFLG